MLKIQNFNFFALNSSILFVLLIINNENTNYIRSSRHRTFIS